MLFNFLFFIFGIHKSFLNNQTKTIMKKMLIGAILVLLCNTTFAQILTLTNHTSCNLFIEIKAEDLGTGWLPCTLESKIFMLPPGPPMVFVGVPSVTSWPGWLSALALPTGGNWNAVKFYFTGGCGSWVGDMVSCGAPFQWSGYCCPNPTGAPNVAIWTPLGGGDVNVDWY